MKDSANKHYLLAILTTVLTFNYVDRLALALVLQDIKADLGLSDTQLGVLSGIAFALFYAIAGIPIARWADRGDRVTIISLTTAAWSAAVALCALAGNFLHLLLIRVGVGIGEAGCVPPAQSLIADNFARAERPRAMARYMLGGSLSLLIGYFLAGWLNELYGWRMMFVLLGLPGLFLAALVKFTLHEPRRTELASHSAPAIQPGLIEVAATLWLDRTFRHLLLCFCIVCFFNFGISKWQPSFLIRSYGFSTGELGTWLAVIYGISGLLGTYWGGELASRRAGNDEALQLRGMAVAYAAFGLISAGVYLSHALVLTFGLMALAALGGAAVIGPLFAMMQTLVHDRMRAVSIAIVYLFANLIGMGLGPLAAGWMSDVLRPLYGEDSLRYALLLLCPGYLWGAWHLWRASQTVANRKHMAAVEQT